MPDLNFSQLQAALPSGAVTTASGDVLFSAKALMGETTVGLTDQKISEFVAKLLNACAKAQSTHNATNGSAPDLNGFPSASAGVPVQGSDGNWYAVFDYSVSVLVPLYPDETSGVTVE